MICKHGRIFNGDEVREFCLEEEKPMNNNPTDEQYILVKQVESTLNADKAVWMNHELAETLIKLIQQHDKQHYASKVREAIEGMQRVVEMKSEYSRGYADGATDAKGNALKSIAEIFK